MVNHGNTMPQIVRALSGVEIAEITDPEYDHLFVVILPPDGPARVIRAQYGHAGPTGQPNGDGMLRGN